VTYSGNENMSWFYVLFFIVFMFVGGFFIKCLCIGVLMERFSLLKQKGDGVLFLGSDQQKYIIGFLYWLKKPPLIEMKPPPTEHKYYTIRKKVYDIVVSNRFKVLVYTVIILNVFASASYSWVAPPTVPGGSEDGYELMAPEKYTLAYSAKGWSSDLNEALDGLNYIFVLFYVAECVMKLMAYGVQYFRVVWFVWEFIAVVFAATEMICSILIAVILASFPEASYDEKAYRDFFMLFSIMRTMRVFKPLIENSVQFRRLTDVLRASVPYLIWTTLLMVVWIFIFGNFGIIFFGDIPSAYTGKFGFPTDNANFYDLSTTYTMMFAFLTNQLWSGMMHDFLDLQLVENDGYTGGDGSNYGYCWMFFVTWMIFAKYMLCNQFGAIVCDTMSETRQAEDHPISKFMTEDFSQKWSKWQLDHQGHNSRHNFMPMTQVPSFLTTLAGKFYISDEEEITKILEKELAIGKKGRVHIVELFDTLMKHVYDREKINLIPKPTLAAIVAGIWALFPDIVDNRLQVDTTHVDVLYNRMLLESNQVRKINMFTSAVNEMAKPDEDPVDDEAAI